MTSLQVDVRDLAAAVTGIAQQHQLRPGMVVVGLIELPDTIQHLLDTTVLYAEEQAPPDARHCAALIREGAERLFGPRLVLGRPRHTFLTVVARRGPLELTASDRRWLEGWQLSDLEVPVHAG